MKTKHVEGFSIACMDEGSIPSDSTIYPRELNVFGVLFFCWVVCWVVRSFLALKNMTDPSDLTMLWMMQESLDYFYRSISISIMPGILRNLSEDQKEEKVINILIKKL
jgi:hypothetical protein